MGAVRAIGGLQLLPNDDGSTDRVNFGFNFYGATSGFVNNNGNITFIRAAFTYRPQDFWGSNVALNLAETGHPFLAAYWGDVDTRADPLNIAEVRYGQATVEGQNAFVATWKDVGVYPYNYDSGRCTFQIIMYEDQTFEFNYDQLGWTLGEVSYSLGPAYFWLTPRAGWSVCQEFYEFDDSGPTSPHVSTAVPWDPNLYTPLPAYLLSHSYGSDVLGRYVFSTNTQFSGWGTPIASGGSTCDELYTSSGDWNDGGQSLSAFRSGDIYGYITQIASGNVWTATNSGIIVNAGEENTANTGGAWIYGSTTLQTLTIAVFGLDVESVAAHGVLLYPDLVYGTPPAKAVGVEVEIAGSPGYARYIFNQGWEDPAAESAGQFAGEVVMDGPFQIAWSSNGGIADTGAPESFPIYILENAAPSSLIPGSTYRRSVFVAGSNIGAGGNPLPQLGAKLGASASPPYAGWTSTGTDLSAHLNNGVLGAAVAPVWADTETQWPETDPPGIDTEWTAAVSFIAGVNITARWPRYRWVYVYGIET